MGQSALVRMENEVLPRLYRPWHPYTVVVAIHRAIWQTNFQAKPFNSAATPFFEARLNMSFFVRAGLKTGTHEKWQVSHTKGRAEPKKALLRY